MTRPFDRRQVSRLLAGLALAPSSLLIGAAAAAAPRVVVIGAGYSGATCAKYLRRALPGAQITVVEPQSVYTSPIFSNEVVVGLKPMGALQTNYAAFAKTYRLTFVRSAVTGIDTAQKTVTLQTGARLGYDRLVLATGIEFRFDGTGIAGYDAAATEIMPHAWQAGAQTTLLGRKLAAMPAGGTAIIAVPPAPYRCPPAPYERASLFAWYLKRSKPGAKVLILDANDTMPKQALFEEAWAALYPGMITRITGSQGGKVVAADPGTLTVTTAGAGSFTGALVNIIPPHKAGALAEAAGLVDQTGWCPVDPVTFESRRVPHVHVIGDASATGLPKSGTSGNAGAKVCAKAIAAALGGAPIGDPVFINTCYSRVAPNYAFGLATVYGVADGALTVLNGATGTSPTGMSAEYRKEEAEDADGWFAALKADTFA